MVRFHGFALATLILVLPAVVSAQETATSEAGPAAGAEPAGASGSTPALASSTGSSLGGTPVSVSDSDATVGSSEGAEASGADVPMSGEVPLATAAQEPEPDLDGPGQEQPGEPGGEPQPPTGDDPVEAPGDEAPDTGGGLPRTGLEALKLALLGLVLVLVGARVRALARRRWTRSKLGADGLPGGTPTVTAVAMPAHDEPEAEREHDERDEADEDDDEAHECAYAEQSRGGRDEWSFPDPNEPAPSGLLPSTAMAKRRAREREGERLHS